MHPTIPSTNDSVVSAQIQLHRHRCTHGIDAAPSPRHRLLLQAKTPKKFPGISCGFRCQSRVSMPANALFYSRRIVTFWECLHGAFLSVHPATEDFGRGGDLLLDVPVVKGSVNGNDIFACAWAGNGATHIIAQTVCTTVLSPTWARQRPPSRSGLPHSSVRNGSIASRTSGAIGVVAL